MALKSKEEVLRDIDELRKSSETSFMDAAVDYANKNDIEIEVIGDIIAAFPKYTEIVREDAENLNYFPKTNRLDILE